MIQNTIESCIREFDFHGYDFDLNEVAPNWQAGLALIISNAVAEDIRQTVSESLAGRFGK